MLSKGSVLCGRWIFGTKFFQIVGTADRLSRFYDAYLSHLWGDHRRGGMLYNAAAIAGQLAMLQGCMALRAGDCVEALSGTDAGTRWNAAVLHAIGVAGCDTTPQASYAVEVAILNVSCPVVGWLPDVEIPEDAVEQLGEC